MEQAYFHLLLSGVFTALSWTPYIAARVVVWGPKHFITNYPEGFPATAPEPPMWAQRAQRAHLNTVETMAAFVAVLIAALELAEPAAHDAIGTLAQVFFLARLVYSAVYVAGVPFLRTPIYLVSWACILLIAAQAL